MPDALGSSISGGFGLIGRGLNYLFNKRLAEQQNQYNIDMWKMQAEFNSPQAQMKRFSEAGLNPNLIYGQGSNGNMSSAPEMVVPQAPEISKQMEKLGQAFNIEGLKTVIAKRKEAQADARLAELSVFDREDERDALLRFGRNYTYDLNTGRFVPFIDDSGIYGKNPRGSAVGNGFTGGARILRYLAEKDSPMRYRDYQVKFLVPQIAMRNYDQQNYGKTFWIDRSGSRLFKSGAVGVHYLKDAYNNYVQPLLNW